MLKEHDLSQRLGGSRGLIRAGFQECQSDINMDMQTRSSKEPGTDADKK